MICEGIVVDGDRLGRGEGGMYEGVVGDRCSLGKGVICDGIVEDRYRLGRRWVDM